MSDLIQGMQQEPDIAVAYGPPGIGKSTFAAGSNNPIFVGPERNGALNANKLTRSKSHDQLCQQIRDLISGKYDKHNFRTLVLDSVDMHEKVIHEKIVAKEPGKSMATAMKGFGKAYNFAGTKLYEIRDLMDQLRDKKEMNIIVLGHSIVSKFEDPMLNISYDQYEMCLHKTKRVDYNNVFMDWANMVLFLTWENYKVEDGAGAVSIGKRKILTEFRPSHYAKNRYNLPYEIEMDSQNPLNTYRMLQNHIDQFYASGMQANTFQNDFNILVHECKQLMSEVKNENNRPAMEQAINQICANAMINPGENLSNITVIRDRIKEIVTNQ